MILYLTLILSLLWLISHFVGLLIDGRIKWMNPHSSKKKDEHIKIKSTYDPEKDETKKYE